MKRDQWNSKLGFLLAAVGSAVGLGNIWRFPYTCASNGGGAFLVPYFFAIITAGIPILILEFTIGHKYRAGAPVALGRMNKKWEVLGWFQVMVAFVILVYYLAIIVWTISYVGFAFTQTWDPDPTSFFYSFLGLTDSPKELGGLQMHLLLPFLAAWAIAVFVIFKGISKGIEKLNKVMIPSLIFLMLIIVIRGLTLPGALDGLNYMFTPQWDKLFDPTIWVAAYGQIFFSLSIAFGIMISYSSYLPEKTDIVNSAFITACSNHGFELFAGIAIFSMLGFMANAQGVPVSEVASGGIGLAFMVFPQAISSLPGLQGLAGVTFFLALFCAGITSLISIIQSVVSGVSDKFQISQKKASACVMAPAFVLSLIFITGAGMYILDIVDAFINSFGITLAGLVEVFLIGWFFNMEDLRQHANRYSDFHIGRWWVYMIKFVTIVVLGVMLFQEMINKIQHPYGDYDLMSLGIFGWGCVIFCAVAGTILWRTRGREGYLSTSHMDRRND